MFSPGLSYRILLNMNDSNRPAVDQNAFQSQFIPYQKGQIHLAHGLANPHAKSKSAQLMMLHGAIENGKIFYSQKGQGLGPFLAQQGLDVWVADLFGRGQSRPAIDAKSQHGQTDSICLEIPAMLDYLERIDLECPQFWVAHSWGGVLLMSVLARYPKYLKRLKGIIFFGTKRQVTVQNRQKWLEIDFFWKGLARLIVRHQGYLPARKLGIGSDSESRLSLEQSVAWIKARGPWLDTIDGFDYGQAIKYLNLPPMLFLAGPQDACLGHPQDVQRFMRELPATHADYWLLSKSNGFAHDYGHIDMLTHKDAQDDHFPQVFAWIQSQL